MAEWAKLKVVDLKAELKNRGLPQAGLKGELVARLEAADEEPAQDEGVEEEAQEEEVQEEANQQREKDVEVEVEAEAEPAEMQDAGGAEPVEITADTTLPEPEPPAAKNQIPDETTPGEAALPAVKQSGSEALAAPQAAQDKTILASATIARLPTPTDDSHETTAVGKPVKPVHEPVAAPSDTPAPEISQAVAPSTQEPTDEMVVDAGTESQKRKRRSASPPPSEEAVARKRARADDGAANGDGATGARLVDGDKDIVMGLPGDLSAEKAAVSDHRDISGPVTHRETPPKDTRDFQQSMDFERDVAPAVHPATSALYINNLMRPLRPNDIRAHLTDLATAPGADVSDQVVVTFYLDQIRTHAFAVFDSTSAASRVRTLLHDSVWPTESNRKALWIDFVPPEKVQTWIDMEEAGGRGRSGSRWEVVYDKGPDGTMEARLESGSMSFSKAGPSPGARPPVSAMSDNTNAIPIGPRSHRDLGPPPTGPRAIRPGTGPGPRPPPDAFPDDFERTRALPVITYKLISEDVARRRIDNMRKFYTRDTHRDLGREINRYSFESGDSFIDRGKEVFEGIRPPHRERDRRGGFGGGRGRGSGFSGRPPRRGPPPFRQRSDRYLPGFNDRAGGHDDRRGRFDDGDRLSRYDGDSFGRDRRH